MATVDMPQVKERWVLGTGVFNLPLSSWSLQAGGDPEGRSREGFPNMRAMQELSLLANTDDAAFLSLVLEGSAFPPCFAQGRESGQEEEMRLARLLHNYPPDSCTMVPIAGKPHLDGCWEVLRRKVCVSGHARSFSETETKLRWPPQSLSLLLLDGGAECRLAQGWMVNKAKITSSTQPSFSLISFLSLNAHMPLPLTLFF